MSTATPSTTLGDAPIEREGKKKVKALNFQTEIINPFL